VPEANKNAVKAIKRRPKSLSQNVSC